MAKLPLIHAVPNKLVVINDRTTDFRLLGKALRLTMWDIRQTQDALLDIANDSGFILEEYADQEHQDAYEGSLSREYGYKEILDYCDYAKSTDGGDKASVPYVYDRMASMYKHVNYGITLMRGLSGPSYPDAYTILSMPVNGDIVCSELVNMTINQLLTAVTEYHAIDSADREYLESILQETHDIKQINAFVIDMPLIMSHERKIYFEIYENAVQ